MKQSPTITVGNTVAESGDAAVVILFDDGCDRANLTPRGARLVASQLLDWALIAEDWKQQPAETRQQEWRLATDPVSPTLYETMKTQPDKIGAEEIV